MEERIISAENVPAIQDNVVVEKPRFKGYTIDEIRYRRALVGLKSQFVKEHLINESTRLSHYNPFGAKQKSGKSGMVVGLASKLLKGLSYMDYFSLGLTAFGTVNKVLKLFRRK